MIQKVLPIEPTFSEDEDEMLLNIDVNPGGLLANVEKHKMQHIEEQQDEVEPLVADEQPVEKSDTSPSLRPARIRRLLQRY